MIGMAASLVLVSLLVVASTVLGFDFPSGRDAFEREPPPFGNAPGPIIPGIYKYSCGGTPVYVGLCGSSTSTCKSRLSEHFGIMKGFFAMQRALIPDNNGNILGDTLVQSNHDHFNHDACVVKKCINALRNRIAGGYPLAVLNDVMQLHVTPISNINGYAVAPFTVQSAERTAIRLLQTQNECNRLAGTGDENAFNLIDLNAAWIRLTWLDPDNRRTLGYTTTIDPPPATQRILPVARITTLLAFETNAPILQNQITTLQADLATRNTFIQTVLAECTRAAFLVGGMLLDGVYPCPPSVIARLTASKSLWWTMCHTIPSLPTPLGLSTPFTPPVFVETSVTEGSTSETASAASVDSDVGVTVGDEASDIALIMKCLQNKCTSEEKKTAVDAVTTRQSGVCDLPRTKPTSYASSSSVPASTRIRSSPTPTQSPPATRPRFAESAVDDEDTATTRQMHSSLRGLASHAVATPIMRP